MAVEQTIRVSAKGEFSQLQRGLKQLQQDLKGVAGVVDKGAGKGGFFDEKQLRALDIYKGRFLGTMRELDAEFRKQNGVVDSLYSKLQGAQRGEREEIKKTIQQRERQLDVIRKELMATERLYNQRYRESGGYRSSSSSSSTSGRSGSSGDSDNASGGASRLAGGALSSVLGAGKFALGLVGLSSIAGLATQAYSSAYARSVNSLDLAQRMRGQAGWNGQATDMWDHASSVGRADRMGYSAAESWGFLDQYSRTAGNISADQQSGLLKFGRAYGLDTSEVASTAGTNRASGGMQTPKGFADAIAGSVAKSGMTPRIIEVMETNNTLLQQMNTTLKDGSSKQILAYQTTLDRIGTEKGMMQLTGAQGGNLIGGLGGIFQPGNDNWKWMGVQALRQYNPKKYGSMDLFGLEESFEDGLMNSDNVPAMAKYVKSQTGGNEKLTKRIMQRWLTDGGFAATKREASEFYDATNGLSVFNPDQLKALENGSIDSGAKYDTERQGAKGQGYMDTDARFEHALEQAGGKLVDIVMGVKEGATTVIEAIQNGTGTGNGILDSILKFMNDNLKGLATTDALGNLGSALSEVLSGKKDLFESLFGGKKTVAANATDGISFATPQQRTQYLRELQREQSNKANSVESEGAALYERAKNGEKLTDAQMQKVYLYNTKHFSNGKQAGTIPKSVVDSGADVTSGFFQQLLQIPMNEFFGGSGDSDIGRMPDQVTRNVEDMSTIGQNKFRQMDRTTSDMAADAATKYMSMERNSSSLLDKTVWIFRNMLYTVQNGTADMLAEFQSLRSSLSASNGGGGLTAMGNGFSISSKITAMSGISAEQLNKKLGGVLAGKGAQFVQAGLQFGIDPAALAAISMHETGNGTSPASRNRHNVGGMMGANGLMNFASIDDGITAMARNLKVNYADKGIDTIEGVQRKYAPVGARNDPDNLNNNWSKGVVKFMNDLTGGVSTGSGSGFFNNWQGRITSKFGQQEGFRKKAHGGLDIKGAQGDQLQALTGGTVSFVKMDDGGPLDSDGKKNTRGGGTEVGIKMSDGSTYFYSHLSAVNPGLRTGQTVSTGDFIGNVGGTPGVAGSGSSTTGSHLHLGYMNSSGKLMNPVDLLNSLGAGDSDIGYMSAASSPKEIRHKSEVTVNLNISGEGAKVLNAATQSQIEKIVKRVVADHERQKLRMSPTRAGYA
ncbi:peptidoglycan DD-metalloendopeptidase family protein [Paenibacillus maysiensis]|uniref:peptidoglycan DD-metalloendopeptidase family protein n=1 Tax=Paenibacillus maysiensis TaxID=1155954 RepID=UPI000472362A|nr:M23 family metallopeptidase [Paenibacillus maysiensis]